MDEIRGLMRRVWVLSASGPVRFCQLAGSPACHVQLCVARAVHCQPRLVSSAQLPPAGRSRCSCPVTFGFRQSSAAHLSCPFLQPLKLFSFSHSQPLQPYLSSSLSWRAQLDLSARLQPHLSLGTWLVNLARSHLPSRDLPPSLLATSSKRGRQGSPSDLP